MRNHIPNINVQYIVLVAPGKGNKPLFVLTDKFCKELANPYLFPVRKFVYNVEGKIILSGIKYFNQRLLSHKQKLASDTNYTFFAFSVFQQLNTNSKINKTMHKVAASNLTTRMFTQNFEKNPHQFVSSNEAFNFMNSIKSRPAYWKTNI